MLAAIRPPDAFIPMRNGKVHHSSDNPGPGAQRRARNPETGRQNNQGFEGLTLTPGRPLPCRRICRVRPARTAATSPETRRYTRMLYYDIADLARPEARARARRSAAGVRKSPTASSRVRRPERAAALDETFFLLLCRDGSNGFGIERTHVALSQHRTVDTSKATNIAGSQYDGTVPVAPNGKLAAGVVPATLTRLHRHQQQCGTEQVRIAQWSAERSQQSLEKWEAWRWCRRSIRTIRAISSLFITNDNDFITQNGYQVGAPTRMRAELRSTTRDPGASRPRWPVQLK